MMGKRALPQVQLGRTTQSKPQIYIAEPTHVGAAARIKWLASTCLTAVIGVGMIGVTLYASLGMDDGRGVMTSIKRASLAALEPVAGVHIVPDGQTLADGKSHRLQTTSLGLSTRHIIHDSVVQRRGTREYIGIKPYARIVARLGTSQPEETEEIPAFNPFKLFADTTPIAQSSGEEGDGVVKRDIEVKVVELTDGLLPREDGVEMRVQQVYELVTEANQFFYSQPFAMKDSIPSEGEDATVQLAAYNPNEFAGVDLAESEAPLNTTIIEKSAGEESDEIADGSRLETIKVKKGDTLTGIMRTAGAEAWQAKAIVDAMAPAFPSKALRSGQEVRFTLVPAPSDTGAMEPVKVSVFDKNGHRVTAALSEGGDYVASKDADDLGGAVEVRTAQYPQRATLYTSIYQSAYAQRIPTEIVTRLLRIHSYDADFKQRVQAGDSFEAFFDMGNNHSGMGGAPGELLYTSLSIDGVTRHFYRYRSPEGIVGFYDENGNSAKKFLMRKPVKGARFTSAFGMRKHPLLKRRRMHTGTDWAAPRGTPILAAGNGVVEKVGRKGGYGNYVRIRHANGYKSAYAHMARFAKGMRPGVKVRQGQVIGYVGSTGLSSGPHLHYEVLVNSRHVNPMKIHVPRGRNLRGKELAEFSNERRRIDGLRHRSPVNTQVASRD